MSKSLDYIKLATKSKDHKFSDPELLNPHINIEDFSFEVINPWELWYNNLDAELIFIGQDFSDSSSLIFNLKNNWIKEKKSSTNKTLISLYRRTLIYCTITSKPFILN